MSDELYFDVLIAKLSGTGRWRRGMANKYSDDKRNLHAAQELERLAQAQFSEIEPQTWAAVKPFLEADYFSDVLNEATRAVGFRNRPKNIDQFVCSVVDCAKAFVLSESIGGAA